MKVRSTENGKRLFSSDYNLLISNILFLHENSQVHVKTLRVLLKVKLKMKGREKGTERRVRQQIRIGKSGEQGIRGSNQVKGLMKLEQRGTCLEREVKKA